MTAIQPTLDDLADGLARAEDAVWSRRRERERDASFRDALAELVADPDPSGAFVRALGLRGVAGVRSSAGAPTLAGLGRRLRRAFLAGEAEGAAGPEGRAPRRAGAARRPVDQPFDQPVSWVAAEATAGPAALSAWVAAELGAGRAVVALVPPALRGPLDALAEVLAWAEGEPEDGSPPLVVLEARDPAAALVAAAGLGARPGTRPSTRLIGAVGAPRVRQLLEDTLGAARRSGLAAGAEPRRAAHRGDLVSPAHAAPHDLADRASEERDPQAARAMPALREESGPVTVHTLRAATVVVGEHEEPARAAARIARLAFGVDALGGYLASAVGAVWVHSRKFASFHAALLDSLEGPDALRPLPCGALPEHRAAYERVHRLGLDEGATLIHTASAREGEGSPRERLLAKARGPSVRAVFTNVDPASRLARELEPAGVLRVLRVAAPRPERDAARLAAGLVGLDGDERDGLDDEDDAG